MSKRLRPTQETSDQSLCESCQNLNLSPERFIIDDSLLRRAKKVRDPYLSWPNLRSDPEFTIKSRSSRTLLGTFREIRYKAAACSFCSVVVQSVKDFSTPDEAQCYMNWEVDGREGSHGLAKGRTRRIHLKWQSKTLQDDALMDSYLVFMAPERYSRFNSDAEHVWGDEALFLGRGIDRNRGNQALVKSWLDLCHDSHHGPCRATGEWVDEFDSMIEESYFGVIDVVDLQLTTLPRYHEPDSAKVRTDDFTSHTYSSSAPGDVTNRRAPFVALSYVWGKDKLYVTTIENIMLHRTHGGLERFLPSLPQVIRDAIDLVSKLGMRYLWVDSLCIVQNSTRSWNLNARVMDLIYGNAELTICAADGEDARTGLRAMQLQVHDPKTDLNGAQLKDAELGIKESAPGVRLMVSRPPETSIRASNWNTRAWTFQERLLSRRCLLFTGNRVYFQCRSTGMSEDIFADRRGAGWSLDLVNAPLQLLRELDCRSIWVYLQCVSLYSSRILTKPKDILAAFAGISNLMKRTMRAPFVFGLPTSHLDLALLWEPQQALKRRKPDKNNKEEVREYDGLEFPSWSWCGWMNDNSEDQPSKLKPLIEYTNGTVGGCLTHLNEWLLKHTWIQWYIRDGRGRLRPLWDENSALEDTSKSKRWRGYRARPEKVRSRAVTRSRDSEVRRRSLSRNRKAGLVREAVDIVSRRHNDEDEDDDDDDDEDSSRSHDAYGRIVPFETLYQNATQFHRTLPENPYNVNMEAYNPDPDKEFPDQPILQFWTWHTSSLHITPSEPRSTTTTTPHPSLTRHDILDENGDWCGSIVIDLGWGKGRSSSSTSTSTSSTRQQFIALSEAKAFTADECEVWTYYIPKERVQSEWDLFHVMLVEWEKDKWRRVAVGKVFKAAFMGPEVGVVPGDTRWMEIVLG
jgi:Heterokaryon incompatibility protein (HET)